MWKKQHQGVRKASSFAIIEGGMKWNPSGSSHQDMQFGELKRMTREDVLTVFNIPPIMVGVFDEANYSNAREQRKIFWVDCVIPRLRKIESVINEKLTPLFGTDLVVMHDLSGIEDIAEDENLRSQSDARNVAAGIETINEVRVRRKLKPVPWGDAWFAPFGLTPVIGKPKEEPATQPSPAPPPIETPPPAKTLPVSVKTKETVPVEEPIAVDPNVVRRDTVWVHYKGLTENLERRWIGPMHTLFNDQEREVIDNLRASDWKKTVNQNRLDKMKNVKTSLDIILFDRSGARTIFRKTAKGLIEIVVESSANDQIDQYGLGIDFNMSNPNVTSWINSKAFKFADEINMTTEEALRSTLSEAIAAGETITQVEDRIAQVFDIDRGSRTAMIARTEVISASNEGAYESYRQSGLVDSTEWISSRDEKVRLEHQIDGETAPIGIKFPNGLLYPGDPAGEPGEVINCRCTIAPIVNKGGE
jgi:hypothetical protein